MFKEQLAALAEFDYMFFLNANTKFMQKVDEEILPPDEIGLLVVQHLGYFNKNNLQFTYDRNPQTHAYIPYGTGKFYVMGAFNGGTREAFTRLIETIDAWADEDYAKGQIPVWHDESYLNRYILEHSYKILSPAYLYPEDWQIPFECKVLILDKRKFGGNAYMRGQTDVKSI